MRLQDIPEDIEPQIGDIIEIEQDDVCFEVRIIGITADGYLCEQDNVQGAVLLEGVALDQDDVTDITGYITEEKVRLDPNCWKGKKIGNPKTKIKGGVRVNNCVPEGQEAVEESGLQYYTGVKKHGEKYMKLAAKAGREGASQEELGRLRDRYSKAEKTKESVEQDVAENASGLGGTIGSIFDPVLANLQRAALLAMQGRHSEAENSLRSAVKNPAAMKEIAGALRNIKPVTINGQTADSSALDKSKPHQEWILKTFVPWAKSVLEKNNQQGVAEAGPFSYGYKKPRKGSVAYWAEKKRKEQEKGKPPIEPKDQMVGVAKVTKGVAEGEGQTQKYEMMMRNGQVKKFVAKDDTDAKRIAAGHGAKSVIRLRGGIPAGKVAEQGVSEAKSLKKRVRVVQGEHAGKTGWIREIKHGIHSTAPKRYYVDIDGGGQADNLPASALRLLKDQSDSQTGMAEGGHDDQFSLSGKMPATDRIPQDSTTGQDQQLAMGDKIKQQTIAYILNLRPEFERSDLELATTPELIQMLRDIQSGKMTEAEYQGRKVPLGKPMAGDVKKSKVYVRKPNGKVVKVNFGDKNMKIKKSNPKRRKSFRARHNCENPGPRWKARYWSCRAW